MLIKRFLYFSVILTSCTNYSLQDGVRDFATGFAYGLSRQQNNYRPYYVPGGPAPVLAQTRGSVSGVYVIADSVSTRMEAMRIVQQKGWSEILLRQAQYVLVVVRSMLWDPLQSSYDSVGELKEAAAQQMNISGDNFVVYLYYLDDELRPSEIHKVDYPAKD